jgi:hypothetical protein
MTPEGAPMRTTTMRTAPLAALACALTALLATAPPATAGTYTVNACTADRFGFSTQAFADFAALQIPTSGMYMRRACAPTDAAPFGLVAGNVLRSGRVKRGRQAGFVIDAPPSTNVVELKWSGRVRRRDCRYSMQMYALAPDGSPVQVRRPDGTVSGAIRNWRANRNCSKTDNKAQIAQVGGIRSPKPFAMLGPATRIVQRTVCVGGSRKRFCSARSINRIQTFWAEATIADDTPPTVSITQDNSFTQGAWVSAGTQSVGYTANDNVGIKLAQALIGDNPRHDRPCDDTRTVPATTTRVASKSTPPSSARARSRWWCGRSTRPITRPTRSR